MQPNFYQYPLPELRHQFAEAGLSPASAGLIYNWYYKQRRFDRCAHHNLPKRTRDFLADGLSFTRPQIAQVHQSADRTVKFLLALEDGRRVETVLIPFLGKYTICLSSQVGCAMNCAFCYTGTQGLTRSLRTEEIVGQLLTAQAWLSTHRPDDDRIANVVYMGQGEPLHNFTAVARSAAIFISQYGLSLAGHRITVSTAGFAPGLRQWKDGMPDVNIALSLHSPFTAKRDQLIPLNRRYPLSEVLPLVDAIPTGKKRFVTYEYLLIRDFNDGPEDARATGELLAGKRAFINLIPFNSFPGSRFAAPPAERVQNFKSILDTFRIPTLVRVQKGDEILAACGQLNSDAKLPP